MIARIFLALTFGLGRDFRIRFGEIEGHQMRLRNIPGSMHIYFDQVAFGIVEINGPGVAVRGTLEVCGIFRFGYRVNGAQLIQGFDQK